MNLLSVLLILLASIQYLCCAMTASKAFRHAIPTSRLGISHQTLVSYNHAINLDSLPTQNKSDDDVPTEFSLVVILSSTDHASDGDGCDDTSNNLSILLGKKLRGFGKGFYNCFGGKLEKSQGEYDHPAKGAVREVQEETGITIPLSVMEDGFVGTVNFTFEDWKVNNAMRVQLYCVFVTLKEDAKDDIFTSQTWTSMDQSQQQGACTPVITTVDPKQIRGCDEIEPEWFHNVHDIPLDQMFADDSLWLTMLLAHYGTSGSSLPQKLMFDACFHFNQGGTEANTIMHYFIQYNTNTDTASRPPRKLTLEKRLFHALHSNHIQSPSIKEFKENWVMANAVRRFMKEEERMEYVLDVAGGHGALAALFLLLVPKCHTAVVIDPAQCTSGKNGIEKAWKPFWSDCDGDNVSNHETTKEKELRYRHECLRTGLRKELDLILQKAKSTNVTVVACHACQHLTDETLQIAAEYGVNVAVMPCCQKDHDGWWKGLAKNLVKGKGNATLSIGALMDILAAGKMMGWSTGSNARVRYQVKMKLMNEAISLQNRMILCRALSLHEDGSTNSGDGDKKKALAHEKLTRAYNRAHQLPTKGGHKATRKQLLSANAVNGAQIAGWCTSSLLTGFCIGTTLSFLVASKVTKSK